MVLLCVGTVAAGAPISCKRRSAPTGAAAGRLAATTFMVGRIDTARLRAWPAAALLHRRLTVAGEAHERWLQDAARDYQDMVNRCGFDPYERLSGVTVGVDRSALAGTNPNALAVFMDGRLGAPEVSRCAAWFAQQRHASLVTSQARGHTVLTARGEPGDTHTPQFSLLDESVLVTDQSFTATALAVADGAQGGLDSGAPLNAMLARFGQETVAAVAVDVAAVRAQNQHDASELVNLAVHANPALPDLALANQVTFGGLGLRVANDAVVVAARAQLPSATLAGQFSAAIQGFIATHRDDLNVLVGQGRARVRSLRTSGALPGVTDVGAMCDQLDAVLDTLVALPGQVVATTDGAQTVLTFSLSAQQVGTLGALPTVMVPAFARYVLRSKTSEATHNITVIYGAEVAHFNRSRAANDGQGARFLPCDPSPAEVPRATPLAGLWTGNWSVLGFGVDRPVRYQYSVIATGAGDTAEATIRARGDLDGDGVTSTFERTIRVQNGELIGSAINIVNELE
jgi:hypothetical protein